jgi:hypothetical protein
MSERLLRHNLFKNSPHLFVRISLEYYISQRSHVNQCMVIGMVFAADPYIHKKDFVKICITKTVAITHEPTLPH